MPRGGSALRLIPHHVLTYDNGGAPHLESSSPSDEAQGASLNGQRPEADPVNNVLHLLSF